MARPEPLVDMVKLAYAEQDDQWGHCMDRMDNQDLAAAHQHLKEMLKTVAAEAKRRGITLPVRVEFGNDEGQLD